MELKNFNFLASGWAARNMKRLDELWSHLIYIQGQFQMKQYSSLLELFKPIAEKYCSLKVKPAVSEEQRKYIVQANLFNEKKLFDKAIEVYKEAS